MRAIEYHTLKELKQNGKLTIIGNNSHNINNQGIYITSGNGVNVYRQRMASPRLKFDLIAKINA